MLEIYLEKIIKDYTIMHMIISKYIVDGKQYEKYIDNFYSENIV